MATLPNLTGNEFKVIDILEAYRECALDFFIAPYSQQVLNLTDLPTSGGGFGVTNWGAAMVS